MDLRERVLELKGTEAFEEVLQSFVQGEMRNLWTSMPVQLSEDSDGKTVKANINIKAQQRDADGKTSYVAMPELAEVPIQFAAGGGMTTTVPLKKEDGGIALFQSRAIGAWREEGGVQQPLDTRSHHLSDPLFLPGVKPKPKDLKDISTEANETRSDDGKNRIIAHPKHGGKISVNNGKQQLDVNATTGSIEATGKTVTVKAGEVASGRAPNTPNTTDRDLNEQLKGLSARVAQSEKSIHGLFDVTSKFREIVQARIPEVAAVAPILNQAPGGLDVMIGAIEGKAMAYLQTQVKQALGMFMSPTLGGVASLLSGGIEGQIEGLKAQIAKLASENPVVDQVEGLKRQVDAVLVRGASAAVEAGQLAPIQAQIDALTKGNPVVSTVLGLKDQLQKLAGLAGGGLNFLEPQKRLANGQTKSVHFSEGS